MLQLIYGIIPLLPGLGFEDMSIGDLKQLSKELGHYIQDFYGTPLFLQVQLRQGLQLCWRFSESNGGAPAGI
jgi:hypothetical protein